MTIEYLQALLAYLRGIIQRMTTGEIQNSTRLFVVAEQALGTDASPDDQAPDSEGCAETVTDLIAKVAPTIQWTNHLSTAAVFEDMKNGKHFEKVSTPLSGDIIISPTGMGNGSMPHGHVGICMIGGAIASNSSATGLFDINYSIDSWHRYFQNKGGYPVLFFRML